MTVKRDVMGRGFFLGGIHISPTDDTNEGYIPYPPFYCDRSSIDGLLSRYGDVTDSDFVANRRWRTHRGIQTSAATSTKQTPTDDIDLQRLSHGHAT